MVSPPAGEPDRKRPDAAAGTIERTLPVASLAEPFLCVDYGDHEQADAGERVGLRLAHSASPFAGASPVSAWNASPTAMRQAIPVGVTMMMVQLPVSLLA